MPPEPQTAGAPDDAPQAKPFAAFVQEQRSGLLHSELSRELADVVRNVMEHGKDGKLTLTLTISPSKVNGAVEVSDQVNAKPPQADRDAGLFFADHHGNLSRRDPRQPELPLREAGHDERRSA